MLVLPSADTPTDTITERLNIGRARNSRAATTCFLEVPGREYTQSFWLFVERATVNTFSSVNTINLTRLAGYLASRWRARWQTCKLVCFGQITRFSWNSANADHSLWFGSLCHGQFRVALRMYRAFPLTKCQLLNAFDVVVAAHRPQLTGTFRSFDREPASSMFFKILFSRHSDHCFAGNFFRKRLAP